MTDERQALIWQAESTHPKLAEDAKEALENVKLINGQDVQIEYSRSSEPRKKKKDEDAEQQSNSEEGEEKKSKRSCRITPRLPLFLFARNSSPKEVKEVSASN